MKKKPSTKASCSRFPHSGSDDDLPPPLPGKALLEGRVDEDGNAMSGRPHQLSISEYDIQILERRAYDGVIQAFNVRSKDFITWEQERLLVSLRKCLRISMEQHKEIVSKLNSNIAASQFREQDVNVGLMYEPHLNSPPRATPPTSKTHVSSMMKSATRTNMSAPLVEGSKDGNKKGWQKTSFSIGKRVRIRWHADNVFYDAKITGYKPKKGLHQVTYDCDCSCEWLDFKEMPPSDYEFVEEPHFPRAKEGRQADLIMGGRRKAEDNSSRGPAARSAPDLPLKMLELLKFFQISPLDGVDEEVERLVVEGDLAKAESLRKTLEEDHAKINKLLAQFDLADNIDILLQERKAAGSQELAQLECSSGEAGLEQVEEHQSAGSQDTGDQRGGDDEDMACDEEGERPSCLQWQQEHAKEEGNEDSREYFGGDNDDDDTSWNLLELLGGDDTDDMAWNGEGYSPLGSNAAAFDTHQR